MRIKFIIGLICCLAWCGLQAQTTSVVYPVPQQMSIGNQVLAIPTGIEILGEETSSANAITLLRSILQEQKKTDPYPCPPPCCNYSRISGPPEQYTCLPSYPI